MDSFRDLLYKKKILFDGAMGTSIQKLKLENSDPPELLNLYHKDELKEIHKSYLDAGSNIIETNTFGANRKRLELTAWAGKIEEINSSAVKAVREVVGNRALIAGSVGPLGEVIEPFGDLSQEEAKNIFYEQIKFLNDSGVDLILIETMISLDEALIALAAARKANSKIVGVTLTFENGAQGLRTPYGETPGQAAKALEKNGADFIGSNCGHGVSDILLVGREMKIVSKLPILLQPNAGIPRVENTKIIYDESPENFARFVKSAVDLGIEMVGGCCGTTEEHIRHADKILSEMKNF
ncbi:MAG: homocysteine S-methyltransferase family protein [Ignavibacteriales bacterium]|nr:homocysteine S-methyltransferase family protein [Ignavibacteriales bacterium]